MYNINNLLDSNRLVSPVYYNKRGSQDTERVAEGQANPAVTDIK